jgi:hypothetical protein
VTWRPAVPDPTLGGPLYRRGHALYGMTETPPAPRHGWKTKRAEVTRGRSVRETEPPGRWGYAGPSKNGYAYNREVEQWNE